MYAVYAVVPYKSQAAQNHLHRLGDLTRLGMVYGGRTCQDFEIWELEFEACSPGLIGTILRSLDAWGLQGTVLAELLETDCEELWTAVTAPIPHRPSLTWCVRRYLLYHPNSWQDYWGAKGRCGVVSSDFLSFLQRYSAVSREQVASGYARVAMQYLSDPRYATADFPAEVHEVVAVGPIRIDFTRRQFVAKAPVPTVWASRGSEDDVFPPHR